MYPAQRGLAQLCSLPFGGEDREGNFILVYTPRSLALLTSEQIDFTPHIAAILQFPPLHAEINHGNVPSK